MEAKFIPSTPTPKQFQPFKVELTLETLGEALLLYSILLATDLTEDLSKTDQIHIPPKFNKEQIASQLGNWYEVEGICNDIEKHIS